MLEVALRETSNTLPFLCPIPPHSILFIQTGLVLSRNHFLLPSPCRLVVSERSVQSPSGPHFALHPQVDMGRVPKPGLLVIVPQGEQPSLRVTIRSPDLPQLQAVLQRQLQHLRQRQTPTSQGLQRVERDLFFEEDKYELAVDFQIVHCALSFGAASEAAGQANAASLEVENVRVQTSSHTKYSQVRCCDAVEVRVSGQPPG